MIQSDNKILVITHQSENAEDAKRQLVNDIAATFRWYASSEAIYDIDKEVLYRLANFQQQLLVQ